MIYAVAFVLSILLGLNLYASWKVLRDDLSTGAQKLMQLGLVWLLPLIGAVIVASLVGGTRHPTVDVPSQSGMELVSYWQASQGSDYASGDHSHFSDHSCD